MEQSKPKARRCGIYTRKSSEEGLEQDFNSLHAQREACEAFIKSQASEGWKLSKTAYDDGGLSGGSMERPALQRLLADIGEGLIDVVVVYKVDRLTRSLADFAKMVELFDAHGVSFVAVTQQFNTTTSMGRLTLNVLLSFAQFEREVTGERIRDKIAASKRKGMWMGGVPPLGYDVRERRLVVDLAEPTLSGTSMSATWNWAASGSSARSWRSEESCRKSGSRRRGSGPEGAGSRVERCTNCSPTQFTSARSATRRSAIPGSTKRFFPENFGRERSSGSTVMRRAAAEPRTGPFRVLWRESSSTPMVSRCTCRERPRADGDTAITYLDVWLTGPRVTMEKDGVWQRRRLNGRLQLRRGTS